MEWREWLALIGILNGIGGVTLAYFGEEGGGTFRLVERKNSLLKEMRFLEKTHTTMGTLFVELANILGEVYGGDMKELESRLRRGFDTTGRSLQQVRDGHKHLEQINLVA